MSAPDPAVLDEFCDTLWLEDGLARNTLDGYRRDLGKVQQLAKDTAVDLFATIPHGSGQTYLREILLVADHAAYHVGQIVIVRRMLGAWEKS